MKFIKWKILIITSLFCIAPIILGLALWERLPETIAIHFDINGKPDNFASRGFVVFGLPLIMAAFQVLSCFIHDIEAKRHGEKKKFEKVVKWIIPAMTVAIYVATLGFGLGWNIDMRTVAVFIVGVMFIAMGNYLPKLDYVKNYKLSTENARKINRFCGFTMVIMGALMLISLFFPPVVSVFCLLLLIPCIIITVIYSVITARKK